MKNHFVHFRLLEFDGRYKDCRYSRPRIESSDSYLTCYKVFKGSLNKIIGEQESRNKDRGNPLGPHRSCNMGRYSEVIHAKSCTRGTFITITCKHDRDREKNLLWKCVQLYLYYRLVFLRIS